jgi:ATPase family associated with various cellular activities (AAA)
MTMSESLGIEALESLRKDLASISQKHVATMGYYASQDGRGFWHQPSKRESASLSSTATCVSSLVRADLWNVNKRLWGISEAVAERLLTKPWMSAGLKKNNPFGLSFIAEGVLDLISAGDYPGSDGHDAIVRNEIAPLLVKAVESPKGPLAAAGAVSIAPYPPSAYLTQLAFRVLSRCYAKDDPKLGKVTKLVRAWSRSEINRQIALITTESRIADPLQLAYAVILASSASVDEQTSPEEKAIVTAALGIFFDQQHPDGSWQPSQPLFHYPEVGNAQCFEYELLTQLLICEPLQNDLLKYLPKLRISALQLGQTAFELEGAIGSDKVGWASGHHPQIEGPESWSTACVYDFAHMFGRLVAEAVRRELFDDLKVPYHVPKRGPAPGSEGFAPDFADARLKVADVYQSLKETMRDRFVLPIGADKAKVANGGRLKPTTPMSAILFGPPGTSKTDLAKLISQHLGWPLLKVDPSYLVQDGMDRLYSRANRLFRMLAMVEQIVVLLDEFDEMGRDRSANIDIDSRFITTAMLPKLAAINDERKIVFLLATNYVSQFDAAFIRGGRFDMIIQIMPPTLEAKLTRPEWRDTLASTLAPLTGRKLTEAHAILADLTFLETQQLVDRLRSDVEDASEEIADAGHRGTMARKADKTTWKEQSLLDEVLIRLPNMMPKVGSTVPP